MKKEKDKFRINWFRRLENRLNYYDVQYDYKLIPALIVIGCFILIGIITLYCLLFG